MTDHPPRRVAKKASQSNRREFTKLQIYDETLHVGDVARIKEYKDEECFGTVLKIWRDETTRNSYVKVRWFYKPSDIFHAKHDFISVAELFDSDHEQDIWVECLYGKVQVLSLEDYHHYDEVEEDLRFSRATYITKENRLEPPFEDWKRICTCRQILNPDHKYLVCDNCGEFYHEKCLPKGVDLKKCPACRL